ncbi:MAG: XTP/dITP diphosphatase [Candidatus Omnitrophica bacterium]|nr:XTP/dITP diphosphatase [Candidatus Omnitrophota bacterium]MBU1996381.1 XTP/dITP diphosphatase [Candidatus Omnitrophota bacterium]MBU4333869.1 XTP/dITP diphosphatase [Candidatus Omnitrophota bacterium]
MKELIVATKNKGKLREIKELLKEFDLNITSLAEYPDAPDIIEDGKEFFENALIKARIIAKYTGKLVLGEDSGIEVEYLNNAPGIFSSRFAGEDANDDDNNAKLIKALDGVPKDKRTARYRCSAALIDGEKIVGVVDGKCEGYITTEPRGQNGFGYDPYFYIEAYGKTFGELDPEIKSKISHRAEALMKVKELIRQAV